MKRDEILPVLYDMAVTIGSEVSLKSLLSRTLQRLLYYTSFPVGFICLEVDCAGGAAGMQQVRIDAAVGDYELVNLVGTHITLPNALLCGAAARESDSGSLLETLSSARTQYQSYLRLPIDGGGVVVLISPRVPESELPLTFMFQPVMAHLARAILLCRNYDAYTSGLITARDQAQAAAHHLAFYDVLTGLPNRQLLIARLEEALAESERGGQRGALFFLDLDQFKTINDVKGHDAGDLLLLEVSRRLRAAVREGDTVARIGGDEFVVVLKELGSSDDAAVSKAIMAAEAIRDSLGQPYLLRDSMHHSTSSIGIVLIRGGEVEEDLLRHADSAMYQAKAAGRNTIRFYDPELQAAIEARAALEDELRSALDKGQLRLYYQLQIDSMNRPLGAEVLLRWQHPERGLVSPAQFIPLAENTGLIVPIGQWVLETACAQLKSWQSHALTRDLRLAVNVSASQFYQPDFVTQVQHALLASGAKASHLKLELTESMVLQDVDDTIEKMRALKLIGLSFSMDDFGTGYSSLQYLKRLPLDQIKIDQSFVGEITNDTNDAVIVQTIIAMSEALGLDVIAEGVETEAQRSFLDAHGCHAFQGYLFGRPVPLDQFEDKLRKGENRFMQSSAQP
ncbi:MAG TPA: EAL domain-containing protein [Gallionella sp.]|nr:EAL domain-containing protein [Gallionella sp.]